MPEIIILMYHMIRDADSRREERFACSPDRFASQLKAARRKHYVPVSLEQVHDHLAGLAQLPDRAITVTLDDGYADNHANAWPILAREGFPATVFVTVNTVGGENRWMTRDDYPARPMLNWSQIREMHSAGIRFGSHTLNHPRLSSLPRNAAAREIGDAKKVLEDKLGSRVDSFAYPYGDLNEQAVDLVREAGYAIACTTRPGLNRDRIDPLRLQRIEIEGTDPPWKVLQKMHYGSHQAGLFEPMKYYWRRAGEKIRAG